MTEETIESEEVKSITEFQSAFIIFAVLHSLRFFNLELYITTLGTYGIVVMDAVLGIVFTYYYLQSFRFDQDSAIYKMTNWLCLLFLCSIPIGVIVGKQTLFYSFYGTVSWGYLNLGIFYFLVNEDIPVSFVKKVLIYLTFAYIVVMVLSYLQYPDNWFGYNLSFNDVESIMSGSMADRGVLRFMIPGEILAPLGFFYVIAYWDDIQFPFLWIILLYAIILMTGTRGPMVLTLVGGLITYFLSKNVNVMNVLKISVLSVALFVTLNIIPFTSNIITKITHFTEFQYHQNGTNIDRVFAVKYFFTEFNEGHFLPSIIGNGVAKSGGFAERLSTIHTLGFWETDTEYSQMFIFFGYVGLAVMAIWFIFLIKTKQTPQNYFLNALFIYIVLCMITGRAFQTNLTILGLVLYIAYIYSLEEIEDEEIEEELEEEELEEQIL